MRFTYPVFCSCFIFYIILIMCMNPSLLPAAKSYKDLYL